MLIGLTTFGFQSRALASKYSGESNSARVCMRYLVLHCSYVLIHFKVPWLIFFGWIHNSVTRSMQFPCHDIFPHKIGQFLSTGVRIGNKDCFSEEVSLKFTSCLWLTHWGFCGSLNSRLFQTKNRSFCEKAVTGIWGQTLRFSRDTETVDVFLFLLFALDSIVFAVGCLCQSVSYVRIVATITTFYPNFSSCHADRSVIPSKLWSTRALTFY